MLGFNRTVDIETAEILVEPNRFIEAIVAPDFEAGAVGVLTTRPKWRDNVRLMQVGQLPAMDPELSIRFLSGGALVQEADTLPAMVTQWRTVTDVPVADAFVGRHLLRLGNGASRQEQRDCTGARYVPGRRRCWGR